MSTNNSINCNLDEQKLREELIQRATARLRHRLLEQSLQDVMQQIVSVQTELESLKVDTITTLDTFSNINENDESTKLDVLERRVDSHKLQLHGILQQSSSVNMKKSDSAMSRFSSLSLMTSIFGRSRKTSVTSHATSIISDGEEEEEEQHPFYDLAGKRSFRAGSFCGSVYQDEQETCQQPIISNTFEVQHKRRQRRQRRQQQYRLMFSDQHSIHDDADSILSDDSSSIYSESNSILSDHDMKHPLSPPRYSAHFFDQIHQQEPNVYKRPQHHQAAAYDDLNDDNDSLMRQQRTYNMHTLKANLSSQRNILDEAMSFLDGLSENGDDGGFGEDMYLLLQNPDLCCKPFSEIENKMDKLRQYQKLSLFKPTSWIQFGIKQSSDMLYDVTCNSLEWCRFLSVLTAAVVISLSRGPEDMKRYPVPSY